MYVSIPYGLYHAHFKSNILMQFSASRLTVFPLLKGAVEALSHPAQEFSINLECNFITLARISFPELLLQLGYNRVTETHVAEEYSFE